jgi:hypothetical protein
VANATSKIGFIVISRNQPRETAAAVRRLLQIVTKKSFARLKEHATYLTRWLNIPREP